MYATPHYPIGTTSYIYVYTFEMCLFYGINKSYRKKVLRRARPDNGKIRYSFLLESHFLGEFLVQLRVIENQTAATIS